MNRLLTTLFCLALCALASSSPLPDADPSPDHGYGAPHSSGYSAPSSGYGAPSSSYGAPSYKPPSYHAPSAPKNEVTHVHHHYHHAPKPTYHAPAKPTYHAPKPTYHSPEPSYHRPSYTRNTRGSGYDSHRDDYHDDDDYIHLHKGELTRSALLFGAGILKGAIITGLINNANNGITIGK